MMKQPMNHLHWDNNSWEVAASIAARRRQQIAAFNTMSGTAETPLPPRIEANRAQLLLQAVILRGPRTEEGAIVQAVTLPWFDIVREIQRDPNVAFQIGHQKWEELVAGAYIRAGWQVTLTPRSGDFGRDIIATQKALGTIRIIDQVKAFKPPHLVSADDVRALMGVLQGDGASKGFLTTTSDFAPKLREDPLIKPFMPSRLELINGAQLFANLQELARE